MVVSGEFVVVGRSNIDHLSIGVHAASAEVESLAQPFLENAAWAWRMAMIAAHQGKKIVLALLLLCNVTTQ